MDFQKALGSVIVVLASGLVAAPTWAASTADSTTWEGSYEADVLPDADGFTNNGDASTFTSLTGSGTVRLNSFGSSATPLGWWSKSPSFNFTTGVSLEIRARVLNAASNANGMWLAAEDATTSQVIARFFSGQVQLDATDNFAFVGAGAADFSEFHTVRITAKAGTDNVNVYLDDNATPSYTTTLESAGTFNTGLLYFGSVTGSAAADWEIDYVRWTDEGAIAPIPEPSMLALLGLGGVTMMFIRRGRN